MGNPKYNLGDVVIVDYGDNTKGIITIKEAYNTSYANGYVYTSWENGDSMIFTEDMLSDKYGEEYSFGGGVAVGGIVGAYLGYQIGKGRPQKASFETEKKIGRRIKKEGKKIARDMTISKKKPQTMAKGGSVENFMKKPKNDYDKSVEKLGKEDPKSKYLQGYNEALYLEYLGFGSHPDIKITNKIVNKVKKGRSNLQREFQSPMDDEVQEKLPYWEGFRDGLIIMEEKFGDELRDSHKGYFETEFGVDNYAEGGSLDVPNLNDGDFVSTYANGGKIKKGDKVKYNGYEYFIDGMIDDETYILSNPKKFGNVKEYRTLNEIEYDKDGFNEVYGRFKDDIRKSFGGDKMAIGGDIKTNREFRDIFNEVVLENEALPNDSTNVLETINAKLEDRGYQEFADDTEQLRNALLDRYDDIILNKVRTSFYAKGGKIDTWADSIPKRYLDAMVRYWFDYDFDTGWDNIYADDKKFIYNQFVGYNKEEFDVDSDKVDLTKRFTSSIEEDYYKNKELRVTKKFKDGLVNDLTTLDNYSKEFKVKLYDKDFFTKSQLDTLVKNNKWKGVVTTKDPNSAYGTRDITFEFEIDDNKLSPYYKANNYLRPAKMKSLLKNEVKKVDDFLEKRDIDKAIEVSEDYGETLAKEQKPKVRKKLKNIISNYGGNPKSKKDREYAMDSFTEGFSDELKKGYYAEGGRIVGQYYYDTRFDKPFRVTFEDGDKIGIEYIDRKNKSTESQTIGKNEFDYNVKMGAWNKYTQPFTYAEGGKISNPKSIKFKTDSLYDIDLSTKVLDRFEIPYKVGVQEIIVDETDYLVVVDYLKGGNDRNINLSDKITSVGSRFAEGGNIDKAYLNASKKDELFIRVVKNDNVKEYPIETKTIKGIENQVNKFYEDEDVQDISMVRYFNKSKEGGIDDVTQFNQGGNISYDLSDVI